MGYLNHSYIRKALVQVNLLAGPFRVIICHGLPVIKATFQECSRGSL